MSGHRVRFGWGPTGGGISSALPTCWSGRELVEAGFERDVEIAAEVDVSDVVPVLRGEAFVDAGAQL